MWFCLKEVESNFLIIYSFIYFLDFELITLWAPPRRKQLPNPARAGQLKRRTPPSRRRRARRAQPSNWGARSPSHGTMRKSTLSLLSSKQRRRERTNSRSLMTLRWWIRTMMMEAKPKLTALETLKTMMKKSNHLKLRPTLIMSTRNMKKLLKRTSRDLILLSLRHRKTLKKSLA